MRARDVAGILILGLGLYTLVTAVTFLSGVGLFFGGTGSSWNVRLGLLAAYLVPMVLLILLADHLIRRHRSIARGLYPEEDASEGSLSAEDLQAILLRVLGLFFLISTIPAVFGFASGLAFIARPGINTPPFYENSRLWNHFAQYGGFLLQAAIGIVLIRRGDRLFRKPKPVPDQASNGSCPTCGGPYRLADYRDDATDRRCSHCGAVLPRAEIDNQDAAKPKSPPADQP